MELAGTHIPRITQEFTRTIDYPEQYLTEALQALVRGRDSRGERISWSRWWQLVWDDPDRLFISVACAHCCRQRRLAFHTFAHAPRSLPALSCNDLHTRCWRDQLHPAAQVE